MFFPLLLIAALPACVSAAITTHSGFKLAPSKPAAFSKRSPLTVSPHVLSFTKRKSTSPRNRYLKSVIARREINKTYYAPIDLDTVFASQYFLTNVTFGTETFLAEIATADTDTWLVGTKFQYLDVNTKLAPLQHLLHLQQIQNESFGVSYANGETLIGIVGTERVTLAGLTVFNQTVRVVTTAAWSGDGVSSCVVGLAFPSATFFLGDTIENPDQNNAPIKYNRIFTKMYFQGYVNPIFSLAIDPGIATGQLAIGGVLNVAVSQPCATAPFQNMNPNEGKNDMTTATSHYYVYAINVGFAFDSQGEQNLNETLALVDSTMLFLQAPASMAQAVNGNFSPPAVQSSSGGMYEVECNATAPRFGFVVENQAFLIDPADMIVNIGDGQRCQSGIQATTNDLRSWGMCV